MAAPYALATAKCGGLMTSDTPGTVIRHEVRPAPDRDERQGLAAGLHAVAQDLDLLVHPGHGRIRGRLARAAAVSAASPKPLRRPALTEASDRVGVEPPHHERFGDHAVTDRVGPHASRQRPRHG